MRKIASPQELVSKLHQLLVYARSSTPSRKKLASELESLAEEVDCVVANDDPTIAEDGFIQTGGTVAEATFKKLKDGSWGLLVNSTNVGPGDQVLTVTKAGKRETKSIGKVIWTGNGVSICTIGGSGGSSSGSGGSSRSRRRPGPGGECQCGACEDLLSMGYSPGQRIRCEECGGWAEAY